MRVLASIVIGAGLATGFLTGSPRLGLAASAAIVVCFVAYVAYKIGYPSPGE